MSEWEYVPLRLPPGVTRLSAAMRLGVHAQFSNWELSRVSLYSDGTRKVWLRRRKQPGELDSPAAPSL